MKYMLRKRRLTRNSFVLKRSKQRQGLQLYTPRNKLHKYFWEFTIGDPDDKPSVPHAHAIETGYRLNAWTGDIYPAGKERTKIIGKLKRKELCALHSDPDFIDFASRQITWYQSQYPNISFYIPEWFILKSKKLQSVKKGNEIEVDRFVYIGSAIIRY